MSKFIIHVGNGGLQGREFAAALSKAAGRSPVIEFTMQGTAANTFNGHKPQIKVVAGSREKAFTTFNNLFPTARPAQVLHERTVKS